MESRKDPTFLFCELGPSSRVNCVTRPQNGGFFKIIQLYHLGYTSSVAAMISGSSARRILDKVSLASWSAPRLGPCPRTSVLRCPRLARGVSRLRETRGAHNRIVHVMAPREWKTSLPLTTCRRVTVLLLLRMMAPSKIVLAQSTGVCDCWSTFASHRNSCRAGSCDYCNGVGGITHRYSAHRDPTCDSDCGECSAAQVVAAIQGASSTRSPFMTRSNGLRALQELLRISPANKQAIRDAGGVAVLHSVVSKDQRYKETACFVLGTLEPSRSNSYGCPRYCDGNGGVSYEPRDHSESTCGHGSRQEGYHPVAPGCSACSDEQVATIMRRYPSDSVVQANGCYAFSNGFSRVSPAQIATARAVGAIELANASLARFPNDQDVQRKCQMTIDHLPDPCADVDCGINGVCEAGICVCATPYAGDRCQSVGARQSMCACAYARHAPMHTHNTTLRSQIRMAAKWFATTSINCQVHSGRSIRNAATSRPKIARVDFQLHATLGVRVS